VTIVVESSITSRLSLFWDFTQRRIVVSYRRFAITSGPHLQVSSRFFDRSLKFGRIGGPETSVRYCYSTLQKIPKERISDVHRGGIMI
jgi:hypothetical protein